MRGRLTFEESLRIPGAKKAFDTLVEDKVDPRLLKSWMLQIARLPDEDTKEKQDRRKAGQLAQRAKGLAKEIERATESHPVLLMITGPELEEMLGLPKMLRRYANVWETCLSVFKGRHASSQSYAIAGLLDIVKSSTGRYHFKEVADLLNAMDLAFRRSRGGPRWDATNLKQLQFRATKRTAKLNKGLIAG